MRILVVDDSKVARAVLKKLLEELGYADIEEATNGYEALAPLKQRPFDLVVTDWNMPGLDGLGLVRAIRDGETPEVPVLMVSSESYSNRIMDVMRAGADGYIRKPFRAELLRAKITEVLKKREMSRQNAASSPLQGRLEEVGFPELIQFMSQCRMNGRLVIGDASVDLRDGELRAARIGTLEGDAAVYEIAEIEEGEFRFESATGDVEENVSLATMPLLLEAMKRRDEKTGVG